jgi:hypothetical protein
MRTEFDRCEEAQPLYSTLLSSHQSDRYWNLLASLDSRIALQSPASGEEIDALRKFAGGTLPDGMENFLLRTNGLKWDIDWLAMSCEGIISCTQQMREIPELFPNNHLLFVGGTGDGDMFCFAKTRSGKWTPKVFWWEHETENLIGFAYGIQDYVSKHVAWCVALDKPSRETNEQEEQKYRQLLRELSGEEDALKGFQVLVKTLEKQRKCHDLNELITHETLIAFLNRLTVEDFRKIPFHRFLE